MNLFPLATQCDISTVAQAEKFLWSTEVAGHERAPEDQCSPATGDVETTVTSGRPQSAWGPSGTRAWDQPLAQPNEHDSDTGVVVWVVYARRRQATIQVC